MSNETNVILLDSNYLMEIEKTIEKEVIKETQASFSKKVEDLVWKDDIGYWEAVCQLTQELGYEETTIGRLLTQQIKAEITIELEDRNLIKKSGANRLL